MFRRWFVIGIEGRLRLCQELTFIAPKDRKWMVGGFTKGERGIVVGDGLIQSNSPIG
jgi:hypothetical protein